MATTPTTFNAFPSSDKSSNLAQWIANRANCSPAHPVFAYGSENRVTWGEASNAISRAAKLVDSYFDLSKHIQRHNGASSLTVGILANLDSVTYHILYLGIIRAGGSAFLISTRNSPTAVVHLLRQTEAQRLIVSADEPVRKLVASTLAIGGDLAVHPAPTFEMLFNDSDSEYNAPGGLLAHIDSSAIILHSSGSTAFPKAITLNHSAVFQWALISDIIGADITQQRLAVHALPVYHTMGFFVLIWAAQTGLTLTVFPPHTPPIVPSPAVLLASAMQSHSTLMVSVPLYVEIWSRDAEATAQLKKFRGILYGGGPLKKAVGDELTRLGVQILSLYGATELGTVTLIVLRKPGDNEWGWQHISPRTRPIFIDQGDDTFELVFVECETHRPLIINTTIDGKNALATNDIVVRHASDPMKYMVVGRKDSQIMLSSGEKTNPGPIEDIICGNALVQAGLMFGRGRDQNGILIQPARDYEFDPSDTSKLVQFRNNIWQSVAEANAIAPSHSRIYKEMILVTHPSRPIEMTAKHTPRRAATLEAYKDEIDAAYAAVQDSVKSDVPMPSRWDQNVVFEYVRQVVQRTLEKEIGDDVDIFEQGGDSLQATYIRNTLVHAVRQRRKGVAEHISQNFVYTNPTISQLVRGLFTKVTAVPKAWSENHKCPSVSLREIEQLISRLSANFPVHRPVVPLEPVKGEVVLLTGSTGALGSQLLEFLVSSPEVQHVYALNRRNQTCGKSLRPRQMDAFRERGLDISIVDSPKVTLVEGNTAIKDLDICPVIFSEIRNKITLIIHNAWRVNFNLALGSFKENIMGVRTLIDLALQSPHKIPPRIIYTSSVGVFRNWDARQGRPLEVRIDDPTLVLGSGYSESKFVGERILENAALATPAFRPVIVRIGQLTSTPNGAWNSLDWLPAIVRSGQVLGVLPARSDRIAWISLDMAARALFDFRHSHSQYLHLAHPNPALWSTVFDVFALRLGVGLVSWTEWFSRLEKWSESGTEKNPAMCLLEFFRGCAPIAQENREAPGIPLMDMQRALRTSPLLVQLSLRRTSCEDAEKWIQYWRSTEFLCS